ncbi:hypothetical protein KSP40_PGU001164 [Platanthera guangdongensis]|uniref:Uncharacterized protein n=1 Tax=Platanthera guangdongensis TaxID=2320717 RepID=A0ABR2MQB8_9ASPA
MKTTLNDVRRQKDSQRQAAERSGIPTGIRQRRSRGNTSTNHRQTEPSGRRRRGTYRLLYKVMRECTFRSFVLSDSLPCETHLIPPQPLLEIRSPPDSFKCSCYLQAHAEIETGAGRPSFLSMTIRRFYPHLSASLGVGLEFNKHDRFGYNFRGKKLVALASNGVLGINVKGRCDTDKDFKQVGCVI